MPLLFRAVTFAAAVTFVGCAHGNGASRYAEPTPEAAKACAGIAPLAVLASAPVPEAAVARGQAFYCLGFYEVAVPELTDKAIGKPVSVAIGEAIASPEPPPLAPDRLSALRWLVYIHRRFPGWDRIIDAVGEVARADLDRPELADVRDDLHALAAQFEYQRGQFDKAIALLRTIPASSRLRVHALLLEGAIHVRRSAPQPALAAFEEALCSASTGAGPERADDRDLAVLSIARTHYATGQFAVASADYDRVPPSSRYWAAAALEGAWTSYQVHDVPRAVSLIRTLAARSGDVPAETMAEAGVLETILAIAQCRRKDVEPTIDRFNSVYPFLFTEAKKLASRDPDALFDIGYSIRRGGTLAPPFDAVLLRRLMADVPVARRFDEADEVEREQARLDALDSDWRASDVGHEVASALSSRRLDVRHRAGEQFRSRLEAFAGALAAQIKQNIRVEYEALEMSTSGVPSDYTPWPCEERQEMN